MPVTNIPCPKCQRPRWVCHEPGTANAAVLCRPCERVGEPQTRNPMAVAFANARRELEAIKAACGPFLRFAARVVEHCPDDIDELLVTYSHLGDSVPIQGLTVGDCRRAVELLGAKDAA